MVHGCDDFWICVLLLDETWLLYTLFEMHFLNHIMMVLFNHPAKHVFSTSFFKSKVGISNTENELCCLLLLLSGIFPLLQSSKVRFMNYIYL